MHWYSNGQADRATTVDLALEEYTRRARISTPTELGPVAEEIEFRMRLLGYSHRDRFAVRLALQEAVVNGFRHGNRGDPHKHLWITFLVGSQETLIEIGDEGNGFDHANVPNPLSEESPNRPGGRGVFLMRIYTSWMSYNESGNRVTLCRRRSDQGRSEPQA
jgi:serine/threonine-protein kinase RsbW